MGWFRGKVGGIFDEQFARVWVDLWRVLCNPGAKWGAYVVFGGVLVGINVIVFSITDIF